MKPGYVVILLIMSACNANDDDGKSTVKTDSISVKTDSVLVDTSLKEAVPDSGKLQIIYVNERFKGVTVEKIGDQKFRLKGRAQIFEANFGWVIEDGHEELKQGFQMTDAGAPEWGNFNFTVDAPKKRPNSTLHIILFESSAKDGSRQYELPILLY